MKSTLDMKDYKEILKYYNISYKSNNSKVFKILVKMDQLLFKIKIFRYFAWSVLITAKKI